MCCPPRSLSDVPGVPRVAYGGHNQRSTSDLGRHYQQDSDGGYDQQDSAAYTLSDYYADASGTEVSQYGGGYENPSDLESASEYEREVPEPPRREVYENTSETA